MCEIQRKKINEKVISIYHILNNFPNHDYYIPRYLPKTYSLITTISYVVHVLIIIILCARLLSSTAVPRWWSKSQTTATIPTFQIRLKSQTLRN